MIMCKLDKEVSPCIAKAIGIHMKLRHLANGQGKVALWESEVDGNV